MNDDWIGATILKLLNDSGYLAITSLYPDDCYELLFFFPHQHIEVDKTWASISCANGDYRGYTIDIWYINQTSKRLAVPILYWMAPSA